MSTPNSIPELVKHARELMNKAVENTRKEFSGIRSGKATTSLLNIIRGDLLKDGPTPLWNAVNVGITALLHHQYAIGFTPPALDGKMHALEVRVSGGDGLTARARKSYLARNER